MVITIYDTWRNKFYETDREHVRAFLNDMFPQGTDEVYKSVDAVADYWETGAGDDDLLAHEIFLGIITGETNN